MPINEKNSFRLQSWSRVSNNNRSQYAFSNYVDFAYSGPANLPPIKVPIGIIFSKQFHGEFHQSAFRYAVSFHNNRFNVSVFNSVGPNSGGGTTTPAGTALIRLVPIISIVDSDNPFMLMHEMCSQLSRGITALIIPPSGFENSFRTIATYASAFKLPVIFTDAHHGGSANGLLGTGHSSSVTSPPATTGPLASQAVGQQSNNMGSGAVHLSPTSASSSSPSSAFGLHPDFTSAIAAVIKHYRWAHIIYLYDSDNGFLRLQSLLHLLNTDRATIGVHLRAARRFTTASEANDILRNIELNATMSHKYVLLECGPLPARAIIMAHVQDMLMSRRNYHFLLTSLVMADYFDFDQTPEFSALNITGFRVERSAASKPEWKQLMNFIRTYPSQFNPPSARTTNGNSRASSNAAHFANFEPLLSSDPAFIFDSVKLLAKSVSQWSNLSRYMKQRTQQQSASNSADSSMPNGGAISWLNCGLNGSHYVTFNLGDQIRQRILKTSVDGLTGPISFDLDGNREKMSIEIVEITVNKTAEKTGNWNMQDGTTLMPVKHFTESKIDYKNKTYYVTSILEEPYLMMRTDAENLTGNDRFEGYCKDLANLIAERLNITYEMHVVKDRKYGSYNKNVDGPKVWNGMVGELMRHEADIAIAPLTITSVREEVIDFTKPFMSLGISIMIKKPTKKNPGIFSFMDPLSSEIWMCIILSYVGVSVVLFLVSRFSPYEWRYEETLYGPHVSNDFSLYNSMWFSLGALMQQGCDVYPRSVAGRMVGSVWWFFTLILLSTYTANLAAFLTVERMVAPINSADDLAKQTEVEYGVLRDSSSMEFFRNAKIAVHKQMWEFMNIRKNVFVDSYQEGIRRVRESKGKYAFLIESSANDYINEQFPCDTLKVGRNLDAKGYGIATPRGSPIREQLNLQLLFLIENGDLTRLENRWWYDRSECKAREAKDTVQNALTLNNVAGCFYILIGGLFTAMVVALGEFIFKAKHDSTRLNMSIIDSMKSILNISVTGKPGKSIGNMQLKNNMEHESTYEVTDADGHGPFEEVYH